MPVDVTIGTVETKLTAQDPDLLQNEAFIARIVAAVKAELEKEQQLEQRRDADRAASRGARRRI